MKRFTFIGIALVGVIALTSCAEQTPDPAEETGADPGATATEESPSPPAVTEARLEGDFTIKLTRRIAGTTDVKKRTYSFEPQCAEGACDVKLIQERAENVAKGTLSFDGKAYEGTTQVKGDCETNTGEVVAAKAYTAISEFKIVVTDASDGEGESVATRIKGSGSAHYEVTPQARQKGCPAAPPRERYTFTGKLTS